MGQYVCFYVCMYVWMYNELKKEIEIKGFISFKRNKKRDYNFDQGTSCLHIYIHAYINIIAQDEIRFWNSQGKFI